jgi:hypothetical protein
LEIGVHVSILGVEPAAIFLFRSNTILQALLLQMPSPLRSHFYVAAFDNVLEYECISAIEV